MTRKDYEALAEHIRNACQHWQTEEDRALAQLVMRGFVENFQEYLEEDNPRFDSARFREACGL